MRNKFLSLSVTLLGCFISSASFADTMPIPTLGTSSSANPIFREIETAYLFGFVIGSDIGAQGEQEFESETTIKARKRGGSYKAVGQEFAYEFVPTQFLKIELSAHGNYNRIRNVDGLDNLDRSGLGGLGAKFKYLVVGRGPGAPVGLALSAEPGWSRLDDGSGKRANSYATEFRIIADTELVANRLYLAANAIYEPGISKERGAVTTERSSNIGLSGGVAYRLTPQITAGAALEYLRSYDRLSFKTFKGQALYVGPTLHVQLTKKMFVAAAFEAQVTGQAADETRSLDLTNFERYRARLKFGVEF